MNGGNILKSCKTYFGLHYSVKANDGILHMNINRAYKTVSRCADT